MSEQIYGLVHCDNNNVIGGFTLDQALELAKQCQDEEIDFYDVTMDLAIAPQLVIDLVNRVKELEEKRAEPFMYGIHDCDGKAHFDELCVSPAASDLESMIENMEGYTITPLYL